MYKLSPIRVVKNLFYKPLATSPNSVHTIIDCAIKDHHMKQS